MTEAFHMPSMAENLADGTVAEAGGDVPPDGFDT